MTMIGCGIELERERYTSVKVMNNNDAAAAAASFICYANMRNLLLFCSHETENQFNLR